MLQAFIRTLLDAVNVHPNQFVRLCRSNVAVKDWAKVTVPLTVPLRAPPIQGRTIPTAVTGRDERPPAHRPRFGVRIAPTTGDVDAMLSEADVIALVRGCARSNLWWRRSRCGSC